MSACTTPNTELVVRVLSDLPTVRLGGPLRAVDITVGYVGSTETILVRHIGLADGRFTVPGDVAILASDPSEARYLDLTVEATIDGFGPLRRRFQTRFQPQRRAELDVWITAGCLSPTVMCPAGTTCGQGARCEPQRDPVLAPFVPLASFDAGAASDLPTDALRPTDVPPTADATVLPDVPMDATVPPDVLMDATVPHDVPMDAVVPPDVLMDATVPHDVPMDAVVPPDVPMDATVPPDVPMDAVVLPDVFRGVDVPPAPPVLGPARPIYPFNGARLRSNLTTFRWECQAGTGLRSRARICVDRACTTTQWVSPEDTTSSVVSPASVDLAEGAHFWRVESLSSTGAVAQMSPTFEFFYELSSVPQGVARGVVGDYNTDGIPDLLAGGPTVGGGSVQMFRWVGMGVSVRAAFAAPAGEAAFGAAVAPAGDIDGDGYVDALVGAPGSSQGATVNVGRVFVHWGSATGLNGVDGTRVQSPTGFPSRFGAAVVGLGDINLDGFADFAVGAPAGIPGAPGGRVYVFYGGPVRTFGLPAFAIDAPPSLLAFGTSLAALGDFNGDGNSDLAVGAPDTNSGNGSVAVLLGPIRPTAPALVGTPSSVPTTGMNAGYGRVLAGVGDFNGGGLDDFVSTSPSVRLAVLIPGASGTGPLSNGIILRNLLGDGGAAPAGFGVAAIGGKINGDSYTDVMIAAPDEGAGQALFYAGGTIGTPVGVDPVALMAPPTGASRAGAGLSLVGDFDNDHRPDVFMGAPTGTARLYRGYFGSARFTVFAMTEADGTPGANAVLAFRAPPRLGWGG